MKNMETSKQKKQNVCCICKRTYEGFGNNPYPLRTRGRCCDECNEQVIIARIIAMYENKK